MELKELYKDYKKDKNIKRRIKIIALDYFSRSNEDKIIVEYKLNNGIEDFGTMSLMSLVFIFIAPAITAVYSGIWLFITCVVLYIYSAIILTKRINLYLFYKRYLKVINDIKDGLLVSKETKETIDIEFSKIKIKAITNNTTKG